MCLVCDYFRSAFPHARVLGVLGGTEQNPSANLAPAPVEALYFHSSLDYSCMKY